MLIVYDSLTGNIQRFVDRLNMRNTKIRNNLIVNEPYVLITYTTGIGEAPKRVLKFLEDNHSYIRAVISSGNRNWGHRYGIAADIISNIYNVPILHKFELSGSDEDIKKITQEVKIIDEASSKMD
jgi:protein involved in ribonucleotide reduction